MKKYRVAIGLVAAVAIYLVLNLFVPLDSYYFDMDDARNKDEDCQPFYQNYDYMFTLEREEEVFDILIDDQMLRFIEIDIKNKLNRTSYDIKAFSVTPINQYIELFHDKNDYHWSSTGNLPSSRPSYPLEWCIVSKTFNAQNDNLKAFEFTYEGEDYCLCYREPSAD